MSRGLNSHGGGDGTFLIRATPLERLLWVISNAFVEISVLGTARLWQPPLARDLAQFLTLNLTLSCTAPAWLPHKEG